MQDIEPELIADYECVTGEGPLWHPDEDRLYWVDIPEGRMFRYDPATGDHEQFYDDGVVGGYTIQADGTLLLFEAEGQIAVYDDGEETAVIDEIPAEAGSRFNDVIAGPEGRVLCGTMAQGSSPGRLYRLETDGTLTTLIEGVETSNGLGFTPDREGLYHAETGAETIWLFDYDRETGDVSNRRVFADVSDGPGRPDGLTVDADGYVWSARWEGGCVVRHDPDDGSEVGRVEFPARKVSSVTFAGASLDDAYVTTAGGRDKDEEGEGAGALFRFDAGASGVPEFRSRVGL